MLTLTAEAAAAINALIDDGDLPEQSALRISYPAATHNGERTYTLTLEAKPRPHDQVVESDGARVFIADDVAAALDDKTLDAHRTGVGAVQFVIAGQE